jgi:hypothetical protein
MKNFPDAVLRLAGLSLILAAAFVAWTLFSAADVVARFEPINYLLALVLILSGSVGSALAGWGNHLFDQIVLSARRTIHDPAREPPNFLDPQVNSISVRQPPFAPLDA